MATTGIPPHPTAEIVVALGKLNDPYAVNCLIDQLTHGEHDIRKTSVEALGTFRDMRGVGALFKIALTDSYDDIKKDAVTALSNILGNSAVDTFLLKLDDDRFDSRIAAIEALGHLGSSRAVAPLIDALNDEHADVRKAIIEALGALRDSSAVVPVIRSLDDTDRNVRLAAVKTLGDLRDSRAVAPLIQVYVDEDGSWNCTILAAKSLRKLKHAIAIEPLVQRLGGLDYRGRAASTGQALVLTPDQDLRVRHAAAEVLGQSEDHRAVEPLINVLDGELGLARKAKKAICQIGFSRAYKPLAEALDVGNDQIRRACGKRICRVHR